MCTSVCVCPCTWYVIQVMANGHCYSVSTIRLLFSFLSSLLLSCGLRQTCVARQCQRAEAEESGGGVDFDRLSRPSASVFFWREKEEKRIRFTLAAALFSVIRSPLAAVFGFKWCENRALSSRPSTLTDTPRPKICSAL